LLFWFVWEHGFVEVNVRRDDNLVAARVPEAVGLRSGFVADEDHGEGFSVGLLSLVVVCPGATTECTEVCHVRDLAGEDFV
jgi:hypothetical protein